MTAILRGLVGAGLVAGGLLQGGCFSALTALEKAHGTPPSQGEKAAAVTADEATMPVQLAALGGVIVYQGVANAAGKNRSQPASPRLVARIRADPEVVFREKWVEKPWTSAEQHSIEAALLDPTVPFTESRLRRLLPALPDRENYVALCARCPEGFLRELFAEARQKRNARNTLIISGLTDNPATPRDILEAIVAAEPGKFEAGTVIRAGQHLAARPPAAGN